MALGDIGSPPSGLGATEQALGPYLRSIKRNWLLVIGVMLVCAIVADLTILRTNPNYQASATVLVSPLPQGDSDFFNTGVVLETGEPARTVQTAAALIDSAPAAQKAAIALGAGWTEQRVMNATSVSPRGESYVLEVTGQAESPALAAKVANAFANAAVRYRGEIVTRNINSQLEALNSRLHSLSGAGNSESTLAGQLGARVAALSAAQAGGADPTLAVIGLATPNGSPTGAPQWLITLLSLIGGFAIGSVAALAVEFFNRRVGDLDELEDLFGVPVLAAVPKLTSSRRSGALLPADFPPPAFEQLRILRVQLSMRERARVVMMTSADAGDGKTTMAAALAAAFAESGESVILIDFDLRQPSIARLLDIRQKHGMEAIDTPLDELLVEVPDLPGVRVLPAIESDASHFATVIAHLPKVLDEAEAMADRIVIDTAPVGFASETLQIAKICDQVVIAVRQEQTDRQRLIATRDLLARSGVPVVGLVATHTTVRPDTSYGYGYGYGYGLDEESHQPGPKTKKAPSSGPHAEAKFSRAGAKPTEGADLYR